MVNRSDLMKAAWVRYRQGARRFIKFDRIAFASALRIEWSCAQARARRLQRERDLYDAAPAAVAKVEKPIVVTSEPAEMSEMERRIDGLKYLSTRYRIDLMERAIRAEYA
ncbi:hypothetical protein ACP4J4_20350 (plasmid) [Aureimonas ureilytica]|uniref:hypothetical protein n=1 Tax=Aureimonas ureilytica TaxID=401562 RepID=UPI003CF602E9